MALNWNADISTYDKVDFCLVLAIGTWGACMCVFK